VDPVTARRHLERLADSSDGDRATLNAVATLLVGLTVRVGALRDAVAAHREAVGSARSAEDTRLWAVLLADDERESWYTEG